MPIYGPGEVQQNAAAVCCTQEDAMSTEAKCNCQHCTSTSYQTAMKLILTLLALCATSLTVKGQAPPQQFVTLYNGESVTAAERTHRIKYIEETVTKAALIAAAYRKFSDGSYGYLGKTLYEEEGIIPPSNATNRLRVVKFGYKVLDSTESGCRIAPLSTKGEPGYDNDIFVVGLGGYTDRTYGSLLLMKRLGDYRYTTVSGSSRTIPKYDAGEPSTKEAFLAAQGR